MKKKIENLESILEKEKQKENLNQKSLREEIWNKENEIMILEQKL